MICGDLNVAHQPIDIMDPESNQKSPGYTQEERNSFNNMLNSGWIDTFRHLYPNKIQYSWWCDKSYAR